MKKQRSSSWQQKAVEEQEEEKGIGVQEVSDDGAGP
jgi:hypothetical protein